MCGAAQYSFICILECYFLFKYYLLIRRNVRYYNMTETTVAQFIEWLKTQDQEAIVRVLVVKEGRNYHPDTTTTENFKPELAYYYDLRGNEFVPKDAPHYNKRYLDLGEI